MDEKDFSIRLAQLYERKGVFARNMRLAPAKYGFSYRLGVVNRILQRHFSITSKN